MGAKGVKVKGKLKAKQSSAGKQANGKLKQNVGKGKPKLQKKPKQPKQAEGGAEEEEEDVEVEDQDFAFVRSHDASALLRFDPDNEEEEDYERRPRAAPAQWTKQQAKAKAAAPVDTLPVRTLEGKLVFPSAAKDNNAGKEEKQEEAAPASAQAQAQAQAPALSKRERKQARRAERSAAAAAAVVSNVDGDTADVANEAAAAEPASKEVARKRKGAVTVAEELTAWVSAREHRSNLRSRMAEVCSLVLAEPEARLDLLREVRVMCVDDDIPTSRLAILSLAAVYCDICPGYRIRLPTAAELEVTVSKEVAKQRAYEAALLKGYEAYVEVLVKAAKVEKTRLAAITAIGQLTLARALVPRTDSADDAVCSAACSALRRLFEADKRGDAILETVQLIAELVRTRHCVLRPESIELFDALHFDADLLTSSSDVATTSKQGATQTAKQLSKKQRRREKAKQAREIAREVQRDLRETDATQDPHEQRRLQTATLSAVFETYFRVLRDDGLGRVGDGAGGAGRGARPLLRAALNGLARLSHLISVDFMSDVLSTLERLAGDNTLALDSRLRCCTAACGVLKAHGHALNVDLSAMHADSYTALMHLPWDENVGLAAVSAAQALLWDSGRQVDMSRVAAFTRRLGCAALHVPPGPAMGLLALTRRMLVRYARIRRLLDNAGGGAAVAASGDVVDDLAHSNALSSCMWELALLARHHHPADVPTTSTPVEVARLYDISHGGFRPAPDAPMARKQQSTKQKHAPVLQPLNEELSPPGVSTYDPEELARGFRLWYRDARSRAESKQLLRELQRQQRMLELYRTRGVKRKVGDVNGLTQRHKNARTL
eukprot:jgi/Chlat1/4774/Chrsp308S00819